MSRRANLPVVANSNGAHLLWPYDRCTPADRAVIKAIEQAKWMLACIRNDWRVA